MQFELDVTVDAYDKYSSNYIKTRLTEGALFNDHIEAPVVRDFIDDIRTFRKINVLDVGCGPGVYTKSFHKIGANVVAIDPSETMIAAAKNNCISSELSNLNKLEFFNLKLNEFKTDRNFSLILATFMLGYFENLRESFEIMENMLTQSGRIITSCLHPDRIFSVSKNDTGYLTGDKDRNKMYEADFLGKDAVIYLHKHSFEEIFSAASDAGLIVRKMREPLLPKGYPYHDSKKAEFYSRNHSIAVFEMARKHR